MKLSKAQREQVRMMFGEKCAYCGCELTGEWHADHVVPIYREREDIGGADTLENIYPACKDCNRHKRVYSVEEWRKELMAQVDRARLRSFNFRTAERFGLVHITGKPVVFWFEKYNAAQ